MGGKRLGTTIKVWKPRVPPTHKNGPRRKHIEIPEELVSLPAGSSIQERKVATELVRRGESWQPQVSVNGGRSRKAGMVVDFYLPKRSLVIRVQGDYWHNRPDHVTRDDAELLVLKAKHLTVVDLWEHEIDADVKAAVAKALGEPT